MKNKSRGFTLIEVLIVLSLTLVVLSVVYGVFYSNNKTLVDTDARSTLQAEAEDMQMNISKIAMQAKCITAASKDNLLSNDTDRGIADTHYNTENFKSKDQNGRDCIEVVQINLDVPEDEAAVSNVYRIKIDKSKRELILESPIGGERVLSRNVNSLKVIPNNINNDEGSLTEAKAITFEIQLEKKQGYSDIKYPVSITVNFRNAD